MNKKIFSLLIVGLILFSFTLAIAQEDGPPETGVGDEDAEKIKNITEKIPMDESGKFDPEKLSPWKSAAELRIDAFNDWMHKNTWWLKYIFGMEPEISFVFIINLILILIFIVNFRNIFVLYSSFSKGVANIIWIALTVIFLQMKIALKISEWLVLNVVSKWWFYIIIVVVLVILIIISFGIGEWGKKRREAKNKMILEINAQKAERLGEVSDKIVGAAAKATDA